MGFVCRLVDARSQEHGFCFHARRSSKLPMLDDRLPQCRRSVDLFTHVYLSINRCLSFGHRKVAGALRFFTNADFGFAAFCRLVIARLQEHGYLTH